MLTSAVALRLEVSPLLANMVAGFILVNAASRHEGVFRALEPLEAPIYAAFFAIAGVHMDLWSLRAAGLVGAVYILARFTGKLFGARAGATIARKPATTRKYLGLCLLPQAGVAIGLALTVKQNISLQANGNGEMILSVVLASVLVSELVGPPLARYALTKSGAAQPAAKPGAHGEDLD